MKVDRASMAVALEMRAPLLDYRIIEFALRRVPSHLKVAGSGSRFLQRKLARRLLPPSLDLDRKQGFVMPIHEWLRGALKPFLLEVLSKRNVQECGIFRPVAVEHLLREHLEGRQNLGYSLWGLMTVTQWMKTFKIHADAEEAPRTESEWARINTVA